MKYVSKIFVTVDVMIIREFNLEQQLLLIKRKNEPFKNSWALPGGFVDENEDLEQAAIRELVEETQVEIKHLLQIGAFGKPKRDPRGHMVSVAYFGKIDSNIIAIAADDAKEINWFSVNELPKLAFDHLDIIEVGIKKYL